MRERESERERERGEGWEAHKTSLHNPDHVLTYILGLQLYARDQNFI